MQPRSKFARQCGWMFVGCSLVLHFITVLAFARKPEVLAAYTVMPIWLWGAAGILLSSLAFYFLRAPLSLVVTGVWAFTILLGADEAKVIANIGKEKPKPGIPMPVDGKRPIRVITLNAAEFDFGDPAMDIALWEPDIILLQEVDLQQVKRIAEAAFQGGGDYRAYAFNGVATRWKITREVRNPDPALRFLNHNVTITEPGGRSIEVVNLHLSSAATNLRLWKKSCWREHRNNRRQRRQEMSVALDILEQRTTFPATHPGSSPVILGGDFNAPADDPIQRQLEDHFVDAFEEAGRGWGNTFQRRIPILRLDQIHTTSHFTPVRCQAVTTRNSDHRMVVADLLLE